MIFGHFLLNIQVDFGATLNIISQKYLQDADLEPPTRKLQMCNETELVPVDKCRIVLHNPKNIKNIWLNSL